ncbi:low-density lipoprotein receptor-related protein 2-like [Branchiostoma floridae x Branchiostoma belcheri]
MYWTDWGAQAKIERAAMDGTGRTALVTSELLWPNGLTIDKSAQRLYWCDGRTYKIESSDLNGYNRQQFYSNFGVHLFGIAVHDTHIYWTAWSPAVVVRSSKTTGVHETIGTGLNRPAGIHLMKSGTYQPVSNACTSQNGGCQHLCLARPGGRTCACRSSWRLQDDGVTCQPLVIVPPSVVWTRRDQVTGINIVEMLPGNSTTIRDGLGSGGSLTVKNLFSVNPPSFLTALDFDIRRQQMFWADSGLQAIHKVDFLNEASVATILKGTSSSVQGLAVDWLNQNLYYTDAYYNWIGLFNTNSSNHHVVVQTGLDRPQGIAVHPSRGQIFWSDRGREPKIERATLSGQNRTVLVSTNIQAPHGMVIDYVTNRLYWADSGLDIIGYYDLDDGTRGVYRYSPGTHFFDIAFDGVGILATDQSGDDLHVIVDGEDVIEAQLRAQPHGVAFYHDSRQEWQETDCQVNNGGCQHTCVGDAGGHRCLCLLGYSLGHDNHTCTEDAGLPSVALLFSSDAGVYWLRHDLPDVPSDVSVSLGTLLSGLRVVAMDVNYAGNMLFYTQDVADGTQRIYRRSLIGGSIDAPYLIYAGGSNIEGIAVDWVASNLYWTEKSHGRIQVSRLDGSFRKVIVSGLDQPLGVAVHPREGFLFWTETGTTPRVARATLAGTETRTLVSGFSVNQPRGLAIDFLEDRIYWVDGFHGTVQSCDVNGGNVVSHSITGAFDLSGITIYKDYVMMTDSDNQRLVIGLRQHDGQFGVHRTVSGLGTEPHNIRMYDGNEQLSHPGPCDEDNGGCGDLCLPVPSGRVCACGEGRFLQLDGQNCGLHVPVPVTTTTQAPVVTTTTREPTTTSTQRPSTTTSTTPQPSTTTTTTTTLQPSTTTTTTLQPSTTTPTTQQPSTTTTTTLQPSTTTSTTQQPSTTTTTPTTTTQRPSSTTTTTTQPSTTTSTTLQPPTTTTTTQQPSTTTSTTQQPSTTTSTTRQPSTTSTTILQPSTTTTTTQQLSTTTSTTRLPSTTTTTTTQQPSTTTSTTLQPSTTTTTTTLQPSTTTTSTEQPSTTTSTTLQPLTSTSTRTLQPSTATTVSPPTFGNTCPNGQSLSFDLSADGHVFINLTLTATDGEGTALQVEGSVTLPGYVDYQPGRQHWSFRAVDKWGRTSTCSFDVTILDSHPPTILNCPGSITMETATDGVTVTWDAPTAVDNSGRDVTLTASKDPGSRFYFADPQNIVTYTARDISGNTATCHFWIILKSEFFMVKTTFLILGKEVLF